MRQLGKYLLIEPIASGGMAEVWRAEVAGPAGFVKQVAVKLVRADRRGDVMKRLATTSTMVAREPHNSNAVNATGEWRPAMDHVGIDVHKKESQVCILTPAGEVTEVRIATTRERFREVMGDRPRAKVLIETSTESEWVARCLEELGHELIVADPGFAFVCLELCDSETRGG